MPKHPNEPPKPENTEENKVNLQQENLVIIIIGTDETALYPSLDQDGTGKVTRQELKGEQLSGLG